MGGSPRWNLRSLIRRGTSALFLCAVWKTAGQIGKNGMWEAGDKHICRMRRRRRIRYEIMMIMMMNIIIFMMMKIRCAFIFRFCCISVFWWTFDGCTKKKIRPNRSHPEISDELLCSLAAICQLMVLAQKYWLVVWNMYVIFHFIYGIIPPMDFHFFQRGKYTTNQNICCISYKI